MQIPTLSYVFLKVFESLRQKKSRKKLFKYFNLQDWMDWTFICDGNNGKEAWNGISHLGRLLFFPQYIDVI